MSNPEWKFPRGCARSISKTFSWKKARIKGGWPAPLYNLYFDSFLLICTSFVVRTRGIVCFVYLLFRLANYKDPCKRCVLAHQRQSKPKGLELVKLGNGTHIFHSEISFGNFSLPILKSCFPEKMSVRRDKINFRIYIPSELSRFFG